MPRLPIGDVLRAIDVPVQPRAEFAEELFTRLEAELAGTAPDAGGPARDEPARRDPVRRMRRRRIWFPRALAAAMAGLIALAALVVGILPGRAPSALAVLREARSKFVDLPSFSASVVRRQFGELIAEEKRIPMAPDFVTEKEIEYLDDRHFRVDVLSNSYDTLEELGLFEQPAGSFVVADGTYLARYDSMTEDLQVGPLEHEDLSYIRFAATDLIDPSLHGFNDERDDFFEDHCQVLPDERVAGRDARRIHCVHPHAQGASFDAWLDRETGVLLRYFIAGEPVAGGVAEVRGTVFEVKTISFTPTFEPETFAVEIPPGARLVWVGGRPVPERFEIRSDQEVVQTIDVPGRGGPLAVAGGYLWAPGIEGGHGPELEEGIGYIARIDTETGDVLSKTLLEPAHRTQPPETTGPLVTATAVASDDRFLWITEYHAGLDEYDPERDQWDYRSRISRLDLRTGEQVSDATTLDGNAVGLAVTKDAVFVAAANERTQIIGPAHLDLGAIHRVDPQTGRVVESVQYEGNFLFGSRGLVADERHLYANWWTSDLDDLRAPGRHEILKIDQRTLEIVDRLTLPFEPYTSEFGTSIVGTDGTLWIATDEQGDATLLEIDAATMNIVHNEDLSWPVSEMTHADGVLWATAQGADKLVAIDTATLKLLGPPIITGSQPRSVVVGAGMIWVSHFVDGSIARVPLPV